MQPPRTDEQTDYHTVTVGEQAVEPAIEQAVVPAIEQAVEPAIEQAVVPAIEQAVEPAIEQAVVPAIEQAVVQAVEQVIDDRTHAQESQTDVTAEDISYLEEDNRARVAESSEPTFSIRSWMLRGCTREGLLLHRFAQCRDPGCCVRTCRATHDKFRETYAIQSDVVVSNSATNELPFQGHRLSTSHLLVDRAKILSRHT